MKTNSRIVWQLSIMIFLSIITQGILLIRSSVLASNFGVSTEMDAYNFANSVAVFIYSFIGAGITTILIPNLLDKEKRSGINIFLTILYSISFIIFLLMMVFKNYITIFYHGANKTYFLNVFSKFITISLFTQFINSFVGFTDAVLQINNKFNIQKTINLVLSSLLVAIILIYSEFTLYTYAILLLLSTILNLFMQLLVVKSLNFKFKLNFNIFNSNFRGMFKSYIPIVLSTGVYQLSLLINTAISSKLGPGKVSLLNFSSNIIVMINLLILGNIATFLYPRLARYVKKEKSDEKVFEYIILLNGLMLLITLLIITLGRCGIEIIYQRGNFIASYTDVVYKCLLIFSISLPLNAIRDLFYRFLYLKDNTLIPFRNSIVVSTI
ncbi:lipid II flippase MurJ, partial [Gottfriedia acidiceleris]|uniref:lipid II flippase MurJ n=1 Tax=Gottfriedia acidiceleris TaxID=371036 RepID=UPI002FFE50D2